MAKKIINRMKRQPAEWEKYLNHICDNRLISIIHKEFIQLNRKKAV